MREIKFNVYPISELSDKAKEKALNNLREVVDFPYYREHKQALDTFTCRFVLVVREYQYGNIPNKYIKYYFGLMNDSYTDIIKKLSGVRLWKYLQNNHSWIKEGCILSGFYLDDVLLSPFLEFLKKPSSKTFDDLIRDSLQAWLDACQKDYDEFYKDSALEEYAFENDMEFYENGQYFRERSLLNVLPSDHNQV